MSDPNELVVTPWTDGYRPGTAMPALIRRKAYYIRGVGIEMIYKANEVVHIRVPRWFVEEHGLKIIGEDKEPEYDI